jgi:predicted DNA-binding transcriptional regulator AlpA
MSSSKPQVFLSMNEVADLLGITVNSAKSYVLKGMLPEPDALIGQHRGWLRKTIKDWNYNRPRASRREPDPSMLKNSRDRRVRRSEP